MKSIMSTVTLLSGLAAADLCAECVNGGAPPMANNVLSLSCDTGAVFESVEFASYGNPTGSACAYTLGDCNAANSISIVEKLCLNQNSCDIYPNTTTFGDPCYGVEKELAVQLKCSNGGEGMIYIFIY